MPSIRVRNSSYASLTDNPSNTLSSRRSTFNLRSPTTPATHTVAPRTRPSLPTLKSGEILDTNGSPVPPPRRQRANTVASRVHSHVMRLPEHASFSHETHGNRDTMTEEASVRRLAGSQAELVGTNYNDGDLNVFEQDWDGHHHDGIVEHLDAIDPQVGVFSTLTNAANSIMIPPTPFYSRRPAISLPISRQPHDETGSLFEDALDRHVDDVIRRPSPIRRTLLGIWAFLKTPMGIITGIYGFLVVFWGAAIVFFLAKFINFHNDNTQGFWVEVSSQVVNGLFTATSVGLIPTRVIDTYRIYKIWHYKRKTAILRAKAGLPQLFDPDDLPDPVYVQNFVRVLTEEEQKDLHRQQLKFQYHQTWYRAHGSETHRAFPINTALLICFFNDGNSIFQVMLCGTMWGMNRFQRPAWSTATLIPLSFLCGIGAAILIWRGGQKAKRVEEVKERLRLALEEIKIPPHIREGSGASMEVQKTTPPPPTDLDITDNTQTKEKC